MNIDKTLPPARYRMQANALEVYYPSLLAIVSSDIIIANPNAIVKLVNIV